MGAPSEDIAFLATSPNRVGVLEALADEPRDRHALQSELDISQPTASRILRDLREREWVIRTGDHYELTRVGELSIAAFTDLREQLDAVHHLSDVAPMLPEEGFDFDLTRLRTADVVRVAEGESGLARTHENAHLASADHVRILTEFVPHQGVETTWRQVTTGTQRLELVIEASTVSVIRADTDLLRWTREMLATDRAEVYRYDADIGYPILITDDTVHLALPNGDEAGMAWISTDDEEVLDWATATFEEHRDKTVRLTDDDFFE
jgi:predicted transcriptional regulator